MTDVESCPFCGEDILQLRDTETGAVVALSHPYTEGSNQRDCYLLAVCKNTVPLKLLELWNRRAQALQPAPPPPAPPPVAANTKSPHAAKRWANLSFVICGGSRVFRLCGLVDLSDNRGRPMSHE